MEDQVSSLVVVRWGFFAVSLIGFFVGVTAGLMAIYRGHIGKGIVACIFCVPYAYFMLFEPSIRPTRMEPKGNPRTNLAVMAAVAALVILIAYVQWAFPPIKTWVEL